MIAAPLIGLSLLPAIFGKDAAVTVSPVDQAMCALDPDGSSGILVGGDSRGLYHVIPSSMEAITGRKCSNVSQWIHFGGDPTTLVNVLRKYPQALASHPILLYSITIDVVNDLGFKGVPMVQLLNWSPREHFRIALRRPRAYPVYFFSSVLPAIGRMSWNKLSGNGFECKEGIYHPPRLDADRGFTPYEGRKKTGFWSLPSREADYMLDGGQRRNLREALDWLSESPIEKIILYNAPIDTAWLRSTDGPIAMAMEARFSDMLAEEAARHPKVTLLDFYRKPLPELEDRFFYDQTHLNHEGAAIFTRHLGQFLKSSF